MIDDFQDYLTTAPADTDITILNGPGSLWWTGNQQGSLLVTVRNSHVVSDRRAWLPLQLAFGRLSLACEDKAGVQLLLHHPIYKTDIPTFFNLFAFCESICLRVRMLMTS